MILSEFVDGMAKFTHPENAAPWDPVGLALGDPSAEVSSVAVCHEVTESVVAALEKKPADVLVTYHPLLFSPTNRLIAGRSPEARAFRLVRLNTALLVTHTDFDAATGGAADALAHAFDLRHVESFGGDPLGEIPDIGRVGDFDATLAVLDARVSDAFGHTGLRITGDRHAHLNRVAVVPGAGSEFIEAAAKVADAIVTGDVSHHRTVRAADLGLAVVDPGHTATEQPGAQALLALVRKVADVPVIDLTKHNPKTWG